MKAIFRIFILLIALLSCTNEKELKPGEYRNRRPGKITQAKYLIQGIDRFTLGSKLMLSNDSSFELITCGNIMTGKWEETGDSLFLTVLSNRLRNDSLNALYPIVCTHKTRMGYKIIKNGLERMVTYGNKKSFDKLEYYKP